MTILVTGASGFLGSHIAEQLARSGRRVRALVRRSSDTTFLEKLAGVELAYGAVEDRASVMRAVDGVTGVVHAAGLVKAKSSEDFLRVNTEGTENLVEAVLKLGPSLRRFVLVSSQAAGGPSDARGTPVRVGGETAPVTAYGRSKLAAEKILLAHPSVRSAIIRPPAIYGPRDGEVLVFFRSVKTGVLPLVSDPTAKFSMIYGPDCARACILALDSDVPSGSTYYVEDGVPITFGEMVALTEKALGTKAWLRIPLPRNLVKGAAMATEVYGKLTNRAVMFTRDKCNELHAPGWVCDGSRARSELGFVPEVTFARGVALTADWYRSAGWL